MMFLAGTEPKTVRRSQFLETSVLLSIPLLLTSCAVTEPEPPKPPILGELEYRLGKTLDEQVDHERRTSVSGERCYNNESGSFRTHQFVFDGPEDKVQVTITDVAGVMPGRSYEYRLYFKDTSGNIRPDAAFRFNMSNPFTASERVHTVSFDLSTYNATGQEEHPIKIMLMLWLEEQNSL